MISLLTVLSSRRIVIPLFALSLLALSVLDANAQPPFAAFLVNNGGAALTDTGTVQVNLGTNDFGNPSHGGAPFMNVLRMLEGFNFNSTSPANFDINGYPISSLSSTANGIVYLPGAFAASSVTWVLKWPTKRPVTFYIFGKIHVVNCYTTTTCAAGIQNNPTFGGGRGCSTSDPILSNSCRVEFNFTNFSSYGFTFGFPSGANNYAPGSGNLIMVRLSDEPAYNACIAAGQAECYTPEFLTLVSGLHPKTIRTMGWSGTNFSNETNPDYRTTTSSLSYIDAKFPPSAWAGGAGSAGAIGCPETSVTCTSDTYTASSAHDTPGTVTNLEVICGVVNAANATATPTLNVDSRGAARIVDLSGGMVAREIHAGPNCFYYDGLLGEWIYNNYSSGITSSVPIEAQAALASKLNANLWYNFPFAASDSYVTNVSTAALNSLPAHLNFQWEYSNELWNGSFSQFHLGYAHGTKWGLPNANNEPIFGWTASRGRQIYNDIAAVWSGVNSSRAQWMLMSQEYGYPPSTNTFLWRGADLNGATYQNYCTWVGGTYSSTGPTCTGDPGYNTTPNRPIDKVTANGGSVGYAAYFQGSAFNCGDGCGGYNSPTPYQISQLQAMLTDFAAGGSGIATAEALLDADIRQGTYNSQAVTFSGVTATLTGGPPLTCLSNSRCNGDGVTITWSGTQPSQFVKGYPYFVINYNNRAGTFQLAAKPSGAAITPSGGSGTITVGDFTGTGVLLDHVANKYGSNNNTLVGWQNQITSNSYRMSVQAYEGGTQMSAPTTADCATMGITAIPQGGGSPTAAGCAYQAAALLAYYLNDVNYGYPIALSYAKQFTGTDATQINFGLVPSSTTPSWLSIEYAPPWSLCAALIPLPACYQTYYGYAAFPYLLNSDFGRGIGDPAANDNTPAFMNERAA